MSSQKDKTGGSAFLIPYIVINLAIGRPIYYVELLLGQFSGQGPLGAFRLSPMFQGNAFGMMWGAFVTTIYYQMIITYAVVYFFHSFKSPLPWTDCFEWWGVPLEGCVTRVKMSHVCGNIRKSLVIAGINDTSAESTVVVSYKGSSVIVSQNEYNSRFAGCVDANASSVDMFYNKVVLNVSSSFEKVGVVQPNLVICYAICWIIIFLTIFKGIKVVGKVVLVTATVPYLILTVMLIRGITLPGASIGLRYLLLPQWDMLLSPDVWRAATEQTFYSLSIGTGGLLVAFASLVVFSVLGNMAFTLDIPIEDVVAAGPGLAFITYPAALSLIPFPNLWAVLFFAMLFFLGIDSQMGNCELLTNSIQELFPLFAKQRTVTAFMYCSFCFLIGLALTTQAGLYVITILDNYLGALIVLFTCLGEAIIVAWGSFLFYSLYEFPRSNVGNYVLPLWADLFGWTLALVGLAPLVIIAVVKLAQCGCSWRRAAHPESDWGPAEAKYRILYRERLVEVGFAEFRYHALAAAPAPDAEPPPQS
ncbi:hypothetical protein MTO96_008407 [Rhipicephalus appendiculatus]